MTKTLTWLLAGAAMALAAGPSLAGAPEAEAQAKADAAGPLSRADQRRELRVFRAERPGHGEWMAMRGEGRAAHMKALLQLRPEQEPALEAFLAATEARPQGDGLARVRRDGESKTTPERLDEMEARLAEQQAAAKARIAATRAFYAQLDPRQKAAFDAMPMLMMAGPAFGPMLLPIGDFEGPHVRVFRERFDRLGPEPPEPPEPPKS